MTHQATYRHSLWHGVVNAVLCGAMTAWRLVAVVALIVLTGVAASAQESKYKFDFGASAGMSGYLGDANNSNMFKHPGMTVDINSRYIYNTRWAFRALLNMTTISGNTADWDNVLPGGANYDFTSTIFDLGARAEFNFFPYGIGETYKRLNNMSPYLVVGLGLCVAHSGRSTTACPTIPMGVGIKYKLNPRLNLGVEFTMTKTLSDRIDGYGLSDLSDIKTSVIKNTDWFSRITFGFTYEFGERCETCHYVD